MKILGWIVLVIFLIGLAVVLGLGKLIFWLPLTPGAGTQNVAALI